MTQVAAGTPAGIATAPDPIRLDLTQVGLFQQVLDRSTDTLPGAPTLRGNGKNRTQESRREAERRSSPSLDPTAAASAELITQGPVKPAVADARSIATGESTSAPPSLASAKSAAPRPVPVAPAPGPAQGPPQLSASKTGAQSSAMSPAATPQARAAKDSPAAPASRVDKQTPAPGKPLSPAVAVAVPKTTVQRAAQPLAALARGGAVRITGTPRVGPATAKAAELKPRTAAPKSAPRPAPEEEPPQAQFGRGLAAALRQNGGTVTLRLEPEALGDLKIRLALEPGRVEAKFEVQSDQARRLLDTSMDSLRSALEAHGLEVARLDVHVAAPQDAGQSFGGADAHGGRHSSGSEDPRPGKDDAARTPQQIAAEPAEEDRPWMGQTTGGAPRLDALA
jgi:flagellar hook-length control protein FliK